MATSPPLSESAPPRLPSVSELLAGPARTSGVDELVTQAGAIPCSSFRTGAVRADAQPQASPMPRVQLGLSVLPTYTPYSSPWSTYAGYGPPAASPHGFGAGGSSWSPGLTIDLQRATLDRSPEFPSSTSGRFNATSHRSPSFTATFHPYSRSPSSSVVERPLSPISPPVHAEFSTRLPSVKRAPQGLLPSPTFSSSDNDAGAEIHHQQLPLRSGGRFPSSASMPTPSVLGLTSYRIEAQASRLQAQYDSSGDGWLACPPGSPSALGLQFATPPLTADSSPTSTEPRPAGWVEADVRWSSEILLGLARGDSTGPSGPSEGDDDAGSVFESSGDEVDDDDLPRSQVDPFDTDSRVSPTRAPHQSLHSIPVPAKKASHAHHRASHRRRRSTTSVPSSTNSADLVGSSAGGGGGRKRASGKASAKSIYDELAGRPFGCEFCSERFLRKNDYNRHKRIHTGERPYSCPTCKLGFMRKSVFAVGYLPDCNTDRDDALLRHLAHSATCAAKAPSRDEFVFGIGAPKRRKSVSSAPSTSRRG